MKKFILKLCSIGLVACILFLAIASGICFGLPGAYDDHYQRGFVYQYRHLEQAYRDGERKLITIGSSNIAFGVDSALLSSETGLTACNLGINAGMGSAYMFETAEKFLSAGDIVLYPFAPFAGEDYGYDLIWLTLDGEADMLSDFVLNHFGGSLKTFGAAAWRKLFHLTGDRALGVVKDMLGGNIDADVYDATSFDPSNGNMIVYRGGPIVSEAEVNAWGWGYDIESLSDWIVDYLNEFNRICEEKGAKFYIVYQAVVRSAVVDASEAHLLAYQDYLESVFDASIIMDIMDSMVGYESSYNTSTHLNSVGMEAYTKLLAECVKPYL